MHKLYAYKILILVVLVSVSGFAQVDTEDSRVFFYDEFGWRLSGSVGAVLFDTIDITFDDSITNTYQSGGQSDVDTKHLEYGTKANLKETLFPSLALRFEFKPYKGLAADFETAYFMHEIDGTNSKWMYQVCPSGEDSCEEVNGSFEGNRKNFVVLVGGNYYFDNSSPFTPYIQADVGISNSFITLDFKDPDSEDFGVANDFQIIPVMQVGAGFDTKLGPVSLGVTYKHIFLGDQIFDYSLSSGDTNIDGEISLGNVGGHVLELKIGSRRSLF